VITADFAISRFRRDLTLSLALKLGLIGGTLVALAFADGNERMFVLMAFLGVWLMLSFKSAKPSRLVADSPALISLGRYEEAEASLDLALRSFSMFRTVKLLSLHHLAVLRHKQHRWDEAAKLCRAVLGQRLGGLGSLSKPSQLMLADALLQLDDLSGAHGAITRLYNDRLSLAEALQLMVLQLDYETRIGAWSSAVHGIENKAQMCELLPSREAAVAQGMMALAAKRAGLRAWSDYLRQRVELLADINELCLRKPILKELFEESHQSSVVSSS
jgi:hypothetical protein